MSFYFPDSSSPQQAADAASSAMYKLLLCWRYLRTRWIALASVISVTLGVATMIVVNAVMAGFSQRDANPYPWNSLRHCF